MVKMRKDADEWAWPIKKFPNEFQIPPNIEIPNISLPVLQKNPNFA
jgi:hypothetical protein